MIVETDASDIGYGGILKQRMHDEEQLVRYHSGILGRSEKNLFHYQKRNFIYRALHFQISR